MENIKQLNNLKIVHDSKAVLQSGGRLKSNSKGNSLDFSDYSQYEIGNDFRKIDWNIYGRTQKLYIKNYEAQRQIIVNIFLDISKSMDALESYKFDYALEIAKNIAYIALNNNNRVIWHQIDQNGNLQPKKILTKQRLINITRQEFEPLIKESYALKLLDLKVGKHETSIILSDCYSSKMKEAIKLFSFRQNNLIVLQTLTNHEKNIPWTGDVLLKDSENDKELKVEINRKIREQYKNKLEEHIIELKDLAKKYGYRFVNLNLEQDINTTILKDLVKERVLR